MKLDQCLLDLLMSCGRCVCAAENVEFLVEFICSFKKYYQLVLLLLCNLVIIFC